MDYIIKYFNITNQFDIVYYINSNITYKHAEISEHPFF